MNYLLSAFSFNTPVNNYYKQTPVFKLKPLKVLRHQEQGSLFCGGVLADWILLSVCHTYDSEDCAVKCVCVRACVRACSGMFVCVCVGVCVGGCLCVRWGLGHSQIYRAESNQFTTRENASKNTNHKQMKKTSLTVHIIGKCTGKCYVINRTHLVRHYINKHLLIGNKALIQPITVLKIAS